jgi:hypothetical protein
MLQGLYSCYSFLRIFLEHFLQEIQSVLLNTLVLIPLECDVARSVLGENLIVGFAGEGADAEQQDVEDESEAEDIADGLVLGVHVLDVDDLRRHVAWRPAPHEEVLLLV